MVHGRRVGEYQDFIIVDGLPKSGSSCYDWIGTPECVAYALASAEIKFYKKIIINSDISIIYKYHSKNLSVTKLLALYGKTSQQYPRY